MPIFRKGPKKQKAGLTDALRSSKTEKPKRPLVRANFLELQSCLRSDPGFGADEEDNMDQGLDLETLVTDPGLSIAAMIDGHGRDGKAVAELIKNHVKQDFENLGVADCSARIKACFTQLNAQACSAEDIDVSDSGASATIVLHCAESRDLIVANVGDTKAVLARGIDSPTGVQLSTDHYPGVDEERQRIIAAGGRVAASDDVQLGEIGELRVWRGTESAPGIPLSRTIGDAIAKEVGVTFEPAIKKLTLAPEDRFLVVASGGVWKVLSPQEVVDIVAQQEDTAQAAEKVLEVAKDRWEELWQGQNTTAMVIAFQAVDLGSAVLARGIHCAQMIPAIEERIMAPFTKSLLASGAISVSSYDQQLQFLPWHE
eukprot:CAMPEP_0119327710 /NCGR_PEP_ID=MMETSP1333-20130426/71486_1 /TAXON_ID=418940 /ORGANISM="Scyphosphaera apsteinii, Strain RCC1455" /LENGTH=370 /DNA_ID=CAMNT_0007336381 /DNA_START=58 /DNA_END=1171 /DNA_ORIENTATION=-